MAWLAHDCEAVQARIAGLQFLTGEKGTDIEPINLEAGERETISVQAVAGSATT